ncbi:6,7-dimethyl-8-ribityllumazine synthase [compost metagenome]
MPIANGILTVDTDAQAHARTREKGRDCARAAVEMANLVVALDSLRSGQNDEDEDEEA